jgi:hypothetical protein
MKLKLTIALAVIALVLGMILAACDDGEIKPIREGEHEKILDTYLVPYYDKDGKLHNTGPNNVGKDTTENYPFFMVDIPNPVYILPPNRPKPPSGGGDGGGDED